MPPTESMINEKSIAKKDKDPVNFIKFLKDSHNEENNVQIFYFEIALNRFNKNTEILQFVTFFLSISYLFYLYIFS